MGLGARGGAGWGARLWPGRGWGCGGPVGVGPPAAPGGLPALQDHGHVQGVDEQPPGARLREHGPLLHQRGLCGGDAEDHRVPDRCRHRDKCRRARWHGCMGLPEVPSPWTGRAPLCLMPWVGMCPLEHRNGDVRPLSAARGPCGGQACPVLPLAHGLLCPTPGPASYAGMVMSIPRSVPGMPTPWEGWPGLTCPPVLQSRWARTRRRDLEMAARPRQRRTGWTAWRGPKLRRVSSLPCRAVPCRARGLCLAPGLQGRLGTAGPRGLGLPCPWRGRMCGAMASTVSV